MLTRSYRPRTRSYLPTGLKGKSIFGWCHAQCELAEELGTHSFTLKDGPVEWEHILSTALKHELNISSDESGVITLRSK